MGLSVLAVIITFGLVIFLHESGHYIVCRLLGVRVDRFAFGFGPELVGITRGGTRFSICWLPLGGFVKPAGESVEESTGKPDEYFGQDWKRRLLIVWAGPVMNYLLAWVLFAGLMFFKGIPEPSNSTTIGDMFTDYPAYAAGLRPGDTIVGLDKFKPANWEDMAKFIYARTGKPIAVTFKRDNVEKTVEITPKLDPDLNHGVIGIAPTTEEKPMGLFASMKEGAYLDWYWTETEVSEIGEKLLHHEKPDMAGPIGIVELVGKAAHSGIADLIMLIALISVAIGLFNFLPIPMLDGGHAAEYIWEGITKKPLTENAQAAINSVGMAFLLAVLIFASYQDILRLRKKSPDDTSAPPSTTAPAAPTPAK